jgi:hypothetical protein
MGQNQWAGARALMRRGARLHADQAGRLFLEERRHPPPPQLSGENHVVHRIKGGQAEHSFMTMKPAKLLITGSVFLVA